MTEIKEDSIQSNCCKMTLYLPLIISTIFGLILSEEISREDFLHDELEQKLELLKYDLKSIEKFVHTNLLYQNEAELEKSTESEEYEYEDYEPEEGEEEYNFEYEDYEYNEGSEDTESGDKNEITESSTAEEVAPQPVEGSSRIGRLLRRDQNDQGKKNGAKKAKKGKKGKKGKKEKKSKKGKKVKKQKGLSAGSGSQNRKNEKKVVSKERKSVPMNLTPEQIRQVCSSQSQWSGNGNLRSVNQGGNGGMTQNQFAEQFKQLTQSFNQLQAALQSIRRNSGSGSSTSGSSGQPEEGVIDNRGVNPGESQESAVGPLVQAAIGAQSAAANALRGLLPGGQVKSE